MASSGVEWRRRSSVWCAAIHDKREGGGEGRKRVVHSGVKGDNGSGARAAVVTQCSNDEWKL